MASSASWESCTQPSSVRHSTISGSMPALETQTSFTQSRWCGVWWMRWWWSRIRCLPCWGMSMRRRGRRWRGRLLCRYEVFLSGGGRVSWEKGGGIVFRLAPVLWGPYNAFSSLIFLFLWGGNYKYIIYMINAEYAVSWIIDYIYYSSTWACKYIVCFLCIFYRRSWGHANWAYIRGGYQCLKFSVQNNRLH